MLWGPKLKLFWHTRGPKKAPLPAPFFFSCGIHIVVFRKGRIVEQFWGLWGVKIALILAPKAL